MTQSNSLHVDNLKCGGCGTTIRKSLEGIEGVSAIDVHTDKGEVVFQADPGLRPRAAETLRAIGYPETGAVHGLATSVANAKSCVSCAIGELG